MDTKFELIFSIGLLFVILFVGLVWNKTSNFITCSSYENITERDTKYSLISGCYVKNTENKWVPLEEMTKSSVVESK